MGSQKTLAGDVFLIKEKMMIAIFRLLNVNAVILDISSIFQYNPSDRCHTVFKTFIKRKQTL